MRRILLIVVALSMGCCAQNVSFNLNNTINVYKYSLPVKCPSTNAVDVAKCASNGHQALNGAGSVWAECDLNPSAECTNPGPPYNPNYVHIVRVTDQNTAGTQGYQYSYHPQPSQGAGDVVWDATDTRLTITASGNLQMPFSFNPNPSSATYLKPQKLYGAGYMINTQTAAFSKVPPPYPGGRTVSLFYALQYGSVVPGLSGHGNDYVIMSYDFSSATTAPTIANGGIKLVADLNQAGHCLPSTYTGKGMAVLSVSDDDQTFSATIGPQDTSYYVLVWNRSLGCSIWRTDTATVTKFDGTTGTIDDTSNNGGPGKCYMHESQIYHDGGKVYLECETCVSGNKCSGNGYFPRYIWETGVPYSGNAHPTGLHTWPAHTDSMCGHNAQGYNMMVNKCIRQWSDGAMAFFERPYNNNETGWALIDGGWPTSTCYFLGSSSTAACPSPDQHSSWANNVDGTDKAPLFYTTYAQFTSRPNTSTVDDTPQYYWDDELQIMPTACFPNCAGNRPYRVAHTYSDPEPTHAAGFADYIAIGSVSPRPAYNQYFYVFTSNWYGQLGCNNGTYSTQSLGLGCPGGHTGMRYDAFIAAIPVSGSSGTGGGGGGGTNPK